MGELLLVLLPAIVLVALIWGLIAALSPRDDGISDAEMYQRDLAERSARHYAAQVEAATAARARMQARTRHEASQPAQHDPGNHFWPRPGHT